MPKKRQNEDYNSLCVSCDRLSRVLLGGVRWSWPVLVFGTTPRGVEAWISACGQDERNYTQNGGVRRSCKCNTKTSRVRRLIISYIGMEKCNSSLPSKCTFSYILRYVKSHHSNQLDQEPNYEYLSHPLDAYHFVRHISSNWERLRGEPLVWNAELRNSSVFNDDIGEIL